MFQFWIRLRLIQILVDLCLLLSVFVLVYFWRVGWVFSSDLMFWEYFLHAVLAVGVWIGFMLFAMYYRIPPRSGGRGWFDIILAPVGGIISSGFLVVVYFFARSEVFSRWISLGVFVFGVLVLLLSRAFFLMLLRRAKRNKIGCYRTLVVGGNRISEHLVGALNTNTYSLHDVVGVIEPYGIYKDYKGAKVLGKLNKLEEVCEAENITAIIQCDAFEHTLSLISFCEEKNIKFELDPAWRGVFEKNLRIRETAGVKLLSFVKRDHETSSKKSFYKMVDIVLDQFFGV